MAQHYRIPNLLYKQFYVTASYSRNPLTHALDNHIITTIAYLAMLAPATSTTSVEYKMHSPTAYTNNSYIRFGNLKQ